MVFVFAGALSQISGPYWTHLGWQHMGGWQSRWTLAHGICSVYCWMQTAPGKRLCGRGFGFACNLEHLQFLCTQVWVGKLRSGNRGQVFTVFLGRLVGDVVVLVWQEPRRQLYPLGKGNYPTLVQKYFNGAVPCQHCGVGLTGLSNCCSCTPCLRKLRSLQSGWKGWLWPLQLLTLRMHMLRSSESLVAVWKYLREAHVLRNKGVVSLGSGLLSLWIWWRCDLASQDIGTNLASFLLTMYRFCSVPTFFCTVLWIVAWCFCARSTGCFAKPWFVLCFVIGYPKFMWPLRLVTGGDW